MKRLTLAILAVPLLCLGTDSDSALAQKGTRPAPPVDKDAPAKFETATFALG